MKTSSFAYAERTLFTFMQTAEVDSVYIDYRYIYLKLNIV